MFTLALATILFASIALGSGCAHRFQAPPSFQTKVEAYEKATIRLRDGRIVEALARTTITGVEWLPVGGAGPIDPSLIETATVTRIKRGRGALHGAGIGLLIGAGLGVFTGYNAGDDDPGEFIAFSAEDKAKLAAAGLGVVGAIVGLIAGTAVGSPSHYDMTYTDVPSGPTLTPRVSRGSAGADMTWRF